MARTDKMKLGLSVRGVGYHVAAWRHPSVSPQAEQQLQHYIDAANIAERGKFDMIFFADGAAIRESGGPEVWPGFSTLARLEPVTLLGALAASTQKIGLAATASTTYNAPYSIARKFGTLDLMSQGRACWNAVTSWSDGEASNFGLEVQLDPELRYERATEFIRVVTGLWESWEQDAFLFDQETGQFHDPTKLHELKHHGKHFDVKGPLNVAPSPQGRPIICQAGASAPGQEMAAATADVVFCAASSLKSAQAFYSSVKGRLSKYGRRQDALKVLPGVSAIVGRTDAEAQEKYRVLQSGIAPEVGKALIGTFVGDLSGYDVDDPLPTNDSKKVQSIGKEMQRLASEGNLTIRQLYERVANGRGHLSIVGSAERVADTLEAWFKKGGGDGFNLAAPYLQDSLIDFVDLVVPILQERGIFREEYEGLTLRENLGIPEHIRHSEAPLP